MAVKINKETNDSGNAQPVGIGGLLKKGIAAKNLFKAEELRSDAKKEHSTKAWRFRIKEGQETSITFLDGGVDEGMLDVPMLLEHTVKHDGRWQPFACVQENEPCPLCEAGDNPSLVGLLTVIEHTPWIDREGKEHKYARRLFAAKRTTLKLLLKLATKREGLRGCVFDVSRSGERTPAVGDCFDFDQKVSDELLVQHFGEMDSVPYNYEEQIMSLTAQQLIDLGLGKPQETVGSEPEMKDSHPFDNEL